MIQGDKADPRKMHEERERLERLQRKGDLKTLAGRKKYALLYLLILLKFKKKCVNGFVHYFCFYPFN